MTNKELTSELSAAGLEWIREMYETEKTSIPQSDLDKCVMDLEKGAIHFNYPVENMDGKTWAELLDEKWRETGNLFMAHKKLANKMQYGKEDVSPEEFFTFLRLEKQPATKEQL